MKLDPLQKQLLLEIADIEGVPQGAFNIRKDGELLQRSTNADVDIVSKTDKSGIDIYIRENAPFQRIDIPVIITKTGVTDLVYNDFHIGAGADVLIVAGCGIHNPGCDTAQHDGIHTFNVGEGAKVKYVEKHYGQGDGNGKRILNPTTVINMAKDSYLEMETVQIKGVDSTDRKTSATLDSGATLIIHEKIMTHGKQAALTDFSVDLNGDGAACHVVSRSVAKDNSHQVFNSIVNGNAKCSGHTECDAIIMDDATVSAIPRINANDVDAELIHEAAIGKIAGDQLIKLMTLGLTEKQAEEQIVNGFLK
ncbi:MAG: SufD family Fe-S cluster assembly protein [Clostridia bacterium]|nr:SufD family Fe-S cluster assembly protein [Clostridia bacterium]